MSMNVGHTDRSAGQAVGLAFVKGAVEQLYYLPFLLLAAVYLLPEAAVAWWLATLFALYGLASLMLGSGRSLRVVVRLAISGALGVSHVALILLLCGEPLTAGLWLICPVAGAFMAERGFAQRRLVWSDSFHTAHMLVGLAAYIAIQPFKAFALHELQPYSWLLTVCGFAAVILFFLLINERHLTKELIDTGKTPAALASRKRNRIMMAVLIGVMLFIALFRQIQERIEQWLKSVLQAIFAGSSPAEEPPPPEPPAAAPPQNMFPPVEEREPSKLMQLIEQIVMYTVYAALAVAAVVLLVLLFKKLFGLLQRLLDNLLRRQAAAQEESGAYHDEIENLMTLTTWRKKMGGRLKGLYRRAGGQSEWSRLATNREKIRYLYKLMISREIERGYAPQPHLTPRETAGELAGWQADKRTEAARKKRNASSGAGAAAADESLSEFVDVYEQARYGSAEPRSEEVERYRKWLQNRS